MARRRASEPKFSVGDSVVVYRKTNGVLDEDSLREGRVIDVLDARNEVRIEYSPAYDDERCRAIADFTFDPFSSRNRQWIGSGWTSTLTLFAGMDEEI